MHRRIELSEKFKFQLQQKILLSKNDILMNSNGLITYKGKMFKTFLNT